MSRRDLAKILTEMGNVDLNNRPVGHNPDGSISTVHSMSIGVPQGTVLIPGVGPDGRIIPEDDALKQYDQTGQHLGIFSSPEEADAYARLLHVDQARQYRGR